MSFAAILRCVALSVLACVGAAAVAAPDAGSLLQQLESQTLPAARTQTLQTPTESSPTAAADSGAVVHVSAFDIEGNQVLGSEALQQALTGFVGRDLTFTQLQEAAWVLVQTYRKAGWLVHALVPPQEIDHGVVKLQVVEAKLGAVQLKYPAQSSLPQPLIQSMVGAGLRIGQPLNLQAMDRLLLLLGDVPGVQANATFSEGDSNGTTDVLIALTQEDTLETQLVLDNFGAVSTGSTRLSVNTTVRNPLGLGDALSLQTVGSDGSAYGRLGYSVPVGAQGWRMGLHVSSLSYQLTGSFAALQASGTAQTGGFDITAPLVRSQASNLNLQFNGDHKAFDNQALTGSLADVQTVSRYHIDVFRTGLNANWGDELLTPAQNASNLQLSWGEVDLRGSPNEARDASGAHTAGSFQKINLGYNREQYLTSTLTGYMQIAAQFADRNLDSSESLYLGGASGVRAYPGNEAGGSAGYTVTMGLKHRIDSTWTVQGFADWGTVRVYQDNADAEGAPLSALNTQTLQGLGLSLTWHGAPGRDISATWSRRVGDNPNAKPDTGTDSDGTLTIDRLWLSAVIRFF